MTPAHLVVIEVVSRRDLHAAAAELGVHVLIGDHRDTAPREGQLQVAADQCPVAGVVRVYRHRRVAQHGLRAGGCDHDVPRSVGERVAQVPDVPVLFLGDDLEVGHGGSQHGVPVDQALATIDEAFLVEAHESLPDCRGEPLVHGEAFIRPVHRSAHAPELARDGAAGVLLPGPDSLHESLATDVPPADALGVELALHHHLGGDARVVGSGLPQRVAPPHPVIAGQRIHDGVLEGVAHVQRAGDVGRRDHDAVGLAITAWCKAALLLPEAIPVLFDGVGVEGLVHGVLGP